jgi:penicillin-binding protein 2
VDQPAEPVGRRGIEEALERSLRGTGGIERFLLDASGERIASAKLEALIEEPRRQLPVPGHDVVLTLDLELQRLAADAVKRHATAAAVVVEVETGRILALVSSPSFDPDVMSDPLARGEREGLEEDPRRPLLDRTLEQAYPPGSTWKLVTAVAGLESGMVSTRDEVTCTGERTVGKYRLLDMHAHGAVDFLEALQVSCNVYFWQVAERAGIDRMAAIARDFGFGEPTGLDIDGELAGTVPDSGMYGGTNSLLRTLNTGIGGGDVRLTVIQLAMAYAAVANGGRLYAPQIVRRVQAASGQVLQEPEPILRRHLDVSAATLQIIREGMSRVVNAKGGTAFSARSGAVKMAGKTGTAPVSGADLTSAHALFAGWAPANRPEIAFAVLVEGGGVGGVVAAPVARKIVDGYFTRVKPRERRRGRGR